MVGMVKPTNYTPALYQSPNADADKLGPAMKSLNPRQQAVVHYLLDTGTDNFSEAARASGYSEDGSDGALRVTAHRLKQNPDIAEALVEEGKRRMAHSLPVFLKTIRMIGGDISHKDALKAATTGAAMSGVSAVSVSKSEQHVIHHGDPGAAIEAKLARLSPEKAAALRAALGLPTIIDITPEKDALDISDLY